MGFINKYPYTDAHELNLDWIIERVTQIDLDLATIEQKATEAAIAGTRAYVDEELANVIAQFNSLKADVDALEVNFASTVSSLNQQYTAFVNQVNANINLMSQRIDAIRAEINADIIGVNARTDLAIQQNNEYIFEIIGEGYADVKVINFFTGARVSIQAMFDYLAQLHVSDGINYSTMASRNKTYAQLAALNIDYTNLVQHGNSLFV